MTEILAGAGVEMLATILLATAFIPVLKSIKMGQKILDIGPRWHKSKEGTPTMGGLFFLVPMVIIGAALAFLKKEPILVAHLVFLLANGAIGFADDYVKFFKKQNEGLTPPQKMVLQFAAATEKAQNFEPQLHEFELYSEEELQEKFDKKEKEKHEKHQS